MTTLTATESAEAARDLRAIRDHIQRVGHWQGRTFFKPGLLPIESSPCCLYGAVIALKLPKPDIHDEEDLRPWYRALVDAVAPETEEIAHWSDTTPTPELLATLTRVADQLDEVSS